MIDFPNSPTVGQTFSSPSGTFKWDGTKWAPITGTTGVVNSWNTRTGAVTLTGADITGAGGALLSSTVLRSYLAGLTLSTSGVSATFVVTAGVAADSTNAFMMTLSSSFNKTTSPWAAGSGNGALDTGTIASSTWYHVYLIMRQDTGAVDVLISLSASSPALPTLPGVYNLYRRIGSLMTGGSGNWVQMTQLGDDFLWTTSFTDVSAIPLVVAPTLKTLTVPTGLQVTASIQGMVQGATGSSYGILFSSPDTGGLAAGASIGRYSVYAPASGGGATAGRDFVRTNTAGQIYVAAQATAAGVTYFINTFGWNDSRGRNS
jgi:hypothetical protein